MTEDQQQPREGPYVTLPVGLYDQMARVYYLWRAGHMREVTAHEVGQANVEGVGVQQTVLDPEPARHSGAEVDKKVVLSARPGLSPDFEEMSEAELTELAQEAEDAARA